MRESNPRFRIGGDNHYAIRTVQTQPSIFWAPTPLRAERRAADCNVSIFVTGQTPLQYGVDVIIAAGEAEIKDREKESLNGKVTQLCQLCQLGAGGAEGHEPRARNAAVGEKGLPCCVRFRLIDLHLHEGR